MSLFLSTWAVILLLFVAVAWCDGHDSESKHEISLPHGGKLTPDEMAFAAKLSDRARRAFAERLTPEQRQEVMLAASGGVDPEELMALWHKSADKPSSR